ncbi:MAG: hypothetical protein ABH829_05035 [archaeon]
MTTLLAVRAPYPELKRHIHHLSDVVYMYFIDISDISGWRFYDFHGRLLRAHQHLRSLRDLRGGKMRIEFGTDFQEKLTSVALEERADKIVLPVAEAPAGDLGVEVIYL